MERKIGEVFQDGDVTLKVIKQKRNCNGCFYRPKLSMRCVSSLELSGNCMPRLRNDNERVIFTKQDQP